MSDGTSPVRRWPTVRRLARFLAPYKGRLLLQVSASLAISGAALLPPIVTRALVDRVLAPTGGVPTDPGSRLRLLGLLVLALLGIRVVSWGAEAVHGWVVAWLGARVTADLRSRLYGHLELLSLGFYDRRDVGALTSRITNDASTLQDFLIRGLPYLLVNGLTMIGILAVMLSMSWQVTLAILVPGPLLWVWAVVFWRRLNALFHRWARANARFSAQLNVCWRSQTRGPITNCSRPSSSMSSLRNPASIVSPGSSPPPGVIQNQSPPSGGRIRSSRTSRSGVRRMARIASRSMIKTLVLFQHYLVCPTLGMSRA